MLSIRVYLTSGKKAVYKLFNSCSSEIWFPVPLLFTSKWVCVNQGESPAFTATFVQSFLTVNNFIMCCNIHQFHQVMRSSFVLLRKYKEGVHSEHSVACRQCLSVDRWFVTLQSAGVGVYRHHAKCSSNCMCSAVWCCQGLFPATARTLLLRPTAQSKSPFPFYLGGWGAWCWMVSPLSSWLQMCNISPYDTECNNNHYNSLCEVIWCAWPYWISLWRRVRSLHPEFIASN